MEPLRRGDFQAVLQFLDGAYAAAGVDAFAGYVARELSTVVPCELASYNHFDTRNRRINWLWHGVEPFPDADKIFVDRMHENPVVLHNAKTPNSLPVKTTDFISQREFRRRGIYSEFYGAMRLDYLMTAKMPSDPSRRLAVAVLRSGKDFSERERRLLTILQPHLLRAHQNAEFLTERHRELSLLEDEGVDLSGGLILLVGDGRIRLMTERAGQWLAEYFGAAMVSPTTLPEKLEHWLRRHEAPGAALDAPPPTRTPFVVARDGRRLVVRLVGGGERRLLLLDEEETAPRPASLAALGLTPRETEVLMWVAAGKTNAVIAAILDLSPRTVQHALERVYRKLGVETRVSAAACAFRAGLRPPREGGARGASAR